jgi:hypothetical protein
VASPLPDTPRLGIPILPRELRRLLREIRLQSVGDLAQGRDDVTRRVPGRRFHSDLDVVRRTPGPLVARGPWPHPVFATPLPRRPAMPEVRPRTSRVISSWVVSPEKAPPPSYSIASRPRSSGFVPGSLLEEACRLAQYLDGLCLGRHAPNGGHDTGPDLDLNRPGTRRRVGRRPADP